MKRGRLEQFYDLLRIAKRHDGISKYRLLTYAGLNQASPLFALALEKGLINTRSVGNRTYCEITNKGVSALICFEELFKRL